MSVKASTWAWEQQCPTATKTVLLALADHADDEGMAWPGRKGLATKVGITDRNITRHLSILEHAGLVVSIPRYRPDGSRTSNLYQLVMSTLTPPLVTIDQAPWIDSSRPLDTGDQTRTVIEPSKEPPEDIHGKDTAPEWWGALFRIKGFKVQPAHAVQWLKGKGISEKRALETALALVSKWPGPAKNPYRDPWATFQHLGDPSAAGERSAFNPG